MDIGRVVTRQRLVAMEHFGGRRSRVAGWGSFALVVVGNGGWTGNWDWDWDCGGLGEHSKTGTE